MRYLCQPDSYSCGPIAILNAMKWAGFAATSREHLSCVQFACRTLSLASPDDPDKQGTYDKDFDRVLKYASAGKFHIRRKKHPSLAEMKKHLKSGGAIAFSYRWEEGNQRGDHYCFIAGIQGRFFICVNDQDARNTTTIRLRTTSTIRKWLKKGKTFPYAWFLTRTI